MTKLMYVAAMALLGLGLTAAQNSATPSDSSNSSKAAQTQNTTPPTSPQSSGPGASSQNSPKAKAHSQEGAPDTTVKDQQSSTTSTTDASGQSDSRPSTSTMGTTGSTPGTENSAPANDATTPQEGSSTDQQPNSSSSPTTPTPHLMSAMTPAARAVATHTPDPGTCMNPAAVTTGGYSSGTAPRNCD